jgi:hypothetical protein
LKPAQRAGFISLLSTTGKVEAAFALQPAATVVVI